jgi:hypothetical protein
MSEIREAYNAALRLELAISGAMARGVMDSGDLGIAVAEAASAVTERLQRLLRAEPAN